MATERHVAGHATHFLRRLDRVADQQVEIALGLYRDPELVRELLTHVQLEDRVDRVAVSLGTERDGPFLVLTRDGKFVTCLAEGMSPGALPVVGPDRLRVACDRVERMRERLAAVDALPDGDGELARLYARLHTAGPALPREDFEALARWVVLLGAELDRSLLTCGARVMELAPVVALERRRLPRARREEVLLDVHTKLAAWAHLLVLANLDARSWRRDVESRIESDERAANYRRSTTVSAAQTCLMMHSARALWAVAQDPSDLLPYVKAMRTTWLVQDRQVRDAALAMIAVRSSKRRAEALKTIAQPLGADASASEAHRAYWEQHAVGPLMRVLSMTDADRAGLLEAHRADVFEVVSQLGDLPIPIERPEDVPDDIVLAFSTTTRRTWALVPHGYALLVSMIPRLATMPAAELFLPRAWCARMDVLRSVEAAEKTLDELVHIGNYPTERETVRRPEAKVGRNDPCPCGSGKKHKKCCG